MREMTSCSCAVFPTILDRVKDVVTSRRAPLRRFVITFDAQCRRLAQRAILETRPLACADEQRGVGLSILVPQLAASKPKPDDTDDIQPTTAPVNGLSMWWHTYPAVMDLSIAELVNDINAWFDVPATQPSVLGYQPFSPDF